MAARGGVLLLILMLRSPDAYGKKYGIVVKTIWKFKSQRKKKFTGENTYTPLHICQTDTYESILFGHSHWPRGGGLADWWAGGLSLSFGVGRLKNKTILQ